MMPILVFNLTLHRKMWSWLAEHPECDEDDYFRVYKIEKIPHACSYACESLEPLVDYSCAEAVINSSKSLCKNFCPLDWGETSCYKSLYNDYVGTWWPQDVMKMISPVREDDRSNIARCIACLPLKSNVRENFIIL